jgi:hypothetical protein
VSPRGRQRRKELNFNETRERSSEPESKVTRVLPMDGSHGAGLGHTGHMRIWAGSREQYQPYALCTSPTSCTSPLPAHLLDAPRLLYQLSPLGVTSSAVGLGRSLSDGCTTAHTKTRPSKLHRPHLVNLNLLQWFLSLLCRSDWC